MRLDELIDTREAIQSIIRETERGALALGGKVEGLAECEVDLLACRRVAEPGFAEQGVTTIDL